MNIRQGLFLFLWVLLASSAWAQNVNLEAYQRRTFTDANGDTLRYRLLYPENYDCSRTYPLVVFLHGSGERGTDNTAQLVHGASLFLDPATRRNFPAFVLFPQCPTTDSWAQVNQYREEGDTHWDFPLSQNPNPALRQVMELLDLLPRELCIDAQRIYLGGLSMGGMGTFELLARWPDCFAAAFPICGGGNPLLAPLYGPTTKMWVFHGAKDQVVPVDLSKEMVKALKRTGADVRYTEYPNVNHDSWTNAFAEPELLTWLFSQRRELGLRYESPVFTNVNKTTTTYFKGTNNDSLQIDYYYPLDDTASNRPILLYVHGGGFSGGNRDFPRFNTFAQRLARMGYVVASMSYRLTMRGKSFSCQQAAHVKVQTFQQAVIDIRRATNHILARTQELGIDPSKIIIAGSSAGAEAAVHAAYWGDQHLPADAPKLPAKFRYAGLISMAGAILDPLVITSQNAIPTMLFHGTCDNLIPYYSASHHYCTPGQPGYLLLHGGGDIRERLYDLSKPFYLVSLDNGGHEWNELPLSDYFDLIVDFLSKDIMAGEQRQLHFRFPTGQTCKLEAAPPPGFRP
ncbi:MAG: alpha/beta hydrolase fold domain-containing protein [Lewinellaceae bacterium]|nr:alpha/beta hydrolase fold domain-containing protein [Lewinellaceae bacterium]